MEVTNNLFSGLGIGFQRNRRVTGYLTAGVKLINDPKQAEVTELVKQASINSTICSKSSKPDCD